MRNLIDAITFVTDCLRDFGIETRGQSRFGTMKRILEQGTVVPDSPNFDIARESIRDARIMEFFFDHFGSMQPTPQMTDVLRRAISDAPLPQDSGDDTAGRDAQTELYVATICLKAGLQPQFCEPDVLTQFDDGNVGFAIKRIKSERKIEKHVKKAGSQILKTGFPGHVVLDVTRVFNSANVSLFNIEDSAVQQAHVNARNHFAEQYFARLQEWTKDRHVISVILLDSIVRLHPSEGWTLDGFTYFIPLDQSVEGREQYSHFRQKFESGLATLPC